MRDETQKKTNELKRNTITTWIVELLLDNDKRQSIIKMPITNECQLVEAEICLIGYYSKQSLRM